MPEVALVAILDADKEGFLRSENSLIQTIGRAARNVKGRAILYADKVTGSMQRALDETARRRSKQQAFNAEHGIVPRGIVKRVVDVMEGARSNRAAGVTGKESTRKGGTGRTVETKLATLPPEQAMRRIKQMEAEMLKHARNLEFEQAARLRDEIESLRRSSLGLPSARAS